MFFFILAPPFLDLSRRRVNSMLKTWGILDEHTANIVFWHLYVICHVDVHGFFYDGH
jgi:hypothetical protein